MVDRLCKDAVGFRKSGVSTMDVSGMEANLKSSFVTATESEWPCMFLWDCLFLCQMECVKMEELTDGMDVWLVDWLIEWVDE